MAEERKTLEKITINTNNPFFSPCNVFQDPATEQPLLIFPGYEKLQSLLIFLLLNLATLLLIDHYPAPSTSLHNLFGTAPPLFWINLACSIYLFTELIMIFSRERKKDTASFALRQVCFLTALYFFYWYAGALQPHFTLLFSCGVLLQLFESFASNNRQRAAL